MMKSTFVNNSWLGNRELIMAHLENGNYAVLDSEDYYNKVFL